jgi:hypothetical protein
MKLHTVKIYISSCHECMEVMKAEFHKCIAFSAFGCNIIYDNSCHDFKYLHVKFSVKMYQSLNFMLSLWTWTELVTKELLACQADKLIPSVSQLARKCGKLDVSTLSFHSPLRG